MKKIATTQGQFAIVDDEDYERLVSHKWYATKSITKSKVKWYITRQYRDPSIRNSKGEAKQIAIPMHREIMDAPKGRHVDHKDGNPLNNQKSNLRICTPQENLWNQGWESSPDKPYKGVYRYVKDKKRGWRAEISHNKVSIPLGWFKHPETAAKTYDKLAKALFGDFAKLNFPE